MLVTHTARINPLINNEKLTLILTPDRFSAAEEAPCKVVVKGPCKVP